MSGELPLDPAAGDGSLREYFARRLPERLREIEEAWGQVRACGWTGEPLRTFHRLAHSLAGAGATFGFPAVTDAARRLERALKPAVQEAGPPPSETAVEELLADLRRCAGL